MPPDIELWYDDTRNALRLDADYRLVASARGIWAVFVTLERMRDPAGGGTQRISHWDGEAFDEVQAPDFQDISIPISSEWVYMDLSATVPYQVSALEPARPAPDATRYTTVEMSIVLGLQATLTAHIRTRGRSAFIALTLAPEQSEREI